MVRSSWDVAAETLVRGVLEEELTVEEALDPVPLAACHPSNRVIHHHNQLSSYQSSSFFQVYLLCHTLEFTRGGGHD